MGADFPDWTIAVVDTGGGSGGYASLTGPGQTATPGDLTQEGGFFVDDSAGHGVSLISNGGFIIEEDSGNNCFILDSGGTLFIQAGLTQVETTGTAGGISLLDHTLGGSGTGIKLLSDNIGVTLSGGGAGAIEVGATGDGIGFYGHGVAAKPTVTGSRGANAALTSLLTALASLGLITNSSTP
jgi:hypothetical protein